LQLAADKKTSVLGRMANKLVEFITSAFLPSITVLAAAGILKGILMLLSVIGILPNTSNTYLILTGISNATFYFLPVFLAMNIAKYFNANIYVNALIAMSLVYPDIIALIGKEGGLTFLGLSVMNISYGNMLFPVLLAIIVSCFLEKGINKIMPELLKGFITPALILAIMVPAILLVFGPIGQIIGSGLTSGFTALYNFSPIICGTVIAPAYMLLCIFGLHWFIVPIMLNNIALTGWDPVMGMCSLPAWVCIGVSLAMMVRSKTAVSRSKSMSAAFSAVFGIIEPTLFPILVALKKPLVLATIINIAAGAVIGIFGSSACGFAPPGPSATTLFIGKGAVPLLIVGAVSMAAGYIGMTFLGYTEIPAEKSVDAAEKSA
jgi:Phosphotransferase system IIC components, glucose/maltose/N-acetylglucosamine-specific